MEQLFSSLTHAVQGAPAIALGAAVVWGILSIVLSPCHLASMPLIVGFISGQGKVSTARAGGIATLFAVGILITIAVIGAITAAAGRMLGDVGRWGNYFVAGDFLGRRVASARRDSHAVVGAGPSEHATQGLVAAFILGLVFGIALGPCTFAYMAPMLGVTFKLRENESALRRVAAAGVRRRPLRGHRAGGNVHGTGAAVPELERTVERRHRAEVHLRRAGDCRRRVAGLLRAMTPEKRSMNTNDTVTVRILNFPGTGGGCACSDLSRPPQYAAMIQRKVAELAAALQTDYPGRVLVEYVDLRTRRRKRRANSVNC